MNDNMSSVSVVIPCLNAARFVERAIGSVVAQGRCVTQILCIDDGSSDDTHDVLKRIAASIPVPMACLTQAHAGSAVARNRGLEMAAAEFVQFLDADDELLPGKLEHQLAVLREHGAAADFVAGSFVLMRRNRPPAYVHPGFPDAWACLINSTLGVTSANLWRRQPLISAGGWNPTQPASQEYELMFRLMRRNPQVALSHLPLTGKIDEPGNISGITGKPSKRRLRNLWAFVNLRISIGEYLQANGLMDGQRHRHLCRVVHEKLKDLYPYEPDHVMEVHRRIIPADFRLSRSDGHGPAAYADLLSAPAPYPTLLQEA